jgi:hypothetical protein
LQQNVAKECSVSDPLIYHRVEFQPADPSEKLRDSIGGHPYLPKGMEYPTCSCGRRMNLYFQFGVREEFGLPYQAGSQFAAFMCETCNDQAQTLHDFFTNETGRFQDQLRANYWDFNGIEYTDGWKRFYRLILLKPEGEFEFLPAEEFIQPCSLGFAKAEEIGTEGEDDVDEDEIDEDDDEIEVKEVAVEAEPGLPGTSTNPWARRDSSRDFKVGGQPAWGGDNDPPSQLLCSCGAPMGFVGFIPDELVFPNDRASEYTWEHVGTFFTGLCVYILACRAQCRAQCHPFAVYPITMP